MLAAEHPLKAMSDSERHRHAETLSGLLHDDPEVLGMLIGEELRLVLQQPGLSRADGPVQIWQYRSDLCVLDVYFSGHVGDDGHFNRVVHYETRIRKKAKLVSSSEVSHDIDARHCLRSIIDSRPAPAAAVAEN